ncbi:alpha/beta hydrolase [Paenibacillus sp. GP183]|uniref:alpha/beta fold hydrolase n=1 Tax=Paenibacillus sp. GP183 TaxID=1882751 RepID=UPI00089D101F|nr:alpha/beta hydrolase [Paenibacillus sp. GP183]SED08692.1 3-oxoadipate enol-lactonase [Paenibacillus sp. GP183]
MSKFLVNGIHLNVEIEGEGEPLLLIHGLGGNIDQMRADMKWLSTKYKTIAYDCRGHGNSDKPASYTLNDHIQDAKALLEELRIEKTRVIGVSGGSYIAQGLAADYPDAIHKLILVVPKSHGTKSSVQLFWERHAVELAGMSEAEQMSYFLNHVFAPGFLEKIEPKIVQIILRPEPILSAGESTAANKAFHAFDLLCHQWEDGRTKSS